MLLRQGTKRFGAPEATTVRAIEAIQQVDRLESLGERIFEPGLLGWDDLLCGCRSRAVPSMRPRATGIFQIMRESSTYQAILQEGCVEGRVAGEQRMLLRQGTTRFGAPDSATVAALEAIQKTDDLERLGERILEASLYGWDDLLRELPPLPVPRIRSDASGVFQTWGEFSAYQAILRQGRLNGERQLLIHLASKRFGAPEAATVAAIEAIEDINRLESLGERILEPDLKGWDELLRTP